MKDNIYYFIHCEVHIIVNICIGKPQKNVSTTVQAISMLFQRITLRSLTLCEDFLFPPSSKRIFSLSFLLHVVLKLVHPQNAVEAHNNCRSDIEMKMLSMLAKDT